MAVDYENMTDEEYFACFKELFRTDGWQIMLIEMTETAHNLNDVQSCKDPDELKFRQGQLHQLGLMLNLQDTLRRAEEEEQVDEIADSVEDY